MNKESEDFKYALADALREVREVVGTTQYAVAEELGVSKTIISNYENGIHKVPAWIVYEYVKESGKDFDDFFELVDLKIEERKIMQR